jgi:Zn-dependent protease
LMSSLGLNLLPWVSLPLQYRPVGFGLLGLLGSQPLLFVLLAVCLLAAITLHEFGHAYVADLLGDRMPRAMGRVTLNPVRHLDPLGTLFIFLVGFGWGKPVEFRPQALSSRRFGSAAVALAGPAMNLLLALGGGVAIRLLQGVGLLVQLAYLFTSINVALAVFNLIPLPPLDGSRLLTIFLPPQRQNIVFWLDRYGFLLLIALLFFARESLLDPILLLVSRAIFAITGSGVSI